MTDASTPTLGRDTVQALNLRIAQRVENRYQLRYSTGPADDRSPVDLTGWTARAQIRSRFDDTAWITLTSAPGGAITLDADGRITIVITGPDTSTVEWDRRDTGIWDLVLTNASGSPTRLLSGRVTVSHQVTRDA